MTEKTVVITGASSGLGLETARALAAKGMRIVMVVRSEARGKAAIADVVKTTGVPEDRLSLVLADLESMAEVRRAGAELRAKLPKIDVLVNNAGVIMGKRELTVDGFEKTFAVNHLAPFLLTHEVMSCLEAAAPARVITVASAGHAYANLDLEDLHSAKGYGEIKVYGTSKLCNILFAREMAKRVDPTLVTSNSMHPGAVRTQWGNTAGGLFSFAVKMARPFMISQKTGADTIIWLASAPEVASVSGEYFYKRKPGKTRKAARNDELAKGLWEASEKLTGVKWA